MCEINKNSIQTKNKYQSYTEIPSLFINPERQILCAQTSDKLNLFHCTPTSAYNKDRLDLILILTKHSTENIGNKGGLDVGVGRG